MSPDLRQQTTATCGSVSPLEASERGVLEVFDKSTAAWADGDVDAFVTWYADHATVIFPGTYLRGSRRGSRDPQRARRRRGSGSIYTHRKLFARLAKATGARALLTEYHLHRPYPAQLDDTTAAYQWLLGQEISARHVTVAGDSFGGGLAISVLLRARDLGLPVAAALMLMSPWVDMTVSNETFQANRDTEGRRRHPETGHMGPAPGSDSPGRPLNKGSWAGRAPTMTVCAVVKPGPGAGNVVALPA